jgi:crotonobetainyl-CoA:carnitine CoA-transferase CaiB-like acyl-CoA transferase
MTLYMIAGIVAAVIAALWTLYRRARQGGEAKVVADVATAAVDTMKKQDQAAAKADPTRAGVKKSLEEGTF